MRRPTRSTVKATEHAGARSQGSDVKGKVAGPSPQRAPTSPSRREDPDRSLPSFQAGRAKQMPLLRLSAFRSSGRPGPWEVGFGDLRRKVLGGRGAPLGPHLRWAEVGEQSPRGTKKECANRMCGMTLETRDHFGVSVTPSALPFPAALSLPSPPQPTHSLTTRAFFCFFFKRVARTRPRRGRASRRAQPFPPRPGPPFPPVSADGWPRLAREPGCMFWKRRSGLQPCDARSALRRPSFPPGSGGGAAAGPGRAGGRGADSRAEGGGRREGTRAGTPGRGRGAQHARQGRGRRAGAPGRGPRRARPAPRPRRASRDRFSRRGGARLRGIMSVCQAVPG